MNLLDPSVIRSRHSPLLSIPLRPFLSLEIFRCSSEYHSNKSSFENRETLRSSHKEIWYSHILGYLDREYSPSLHHSPIERSLHRILSNSHLHLRAKISNRSNRDWSIFSANIPRKHSEISSIFSFLFLRDSLNFSGKTRKRSILIRQQVLFHEKNENKLFMLFWVASISHSQRDVREMNLSPHDESILMMYRIKLVSQKLPRISTLHERSLILMESQGDLIFNHVGWQQVS